MAAEATRIGVAGALDAVARAHGGGDQFKMRVRGVARVFEWFGERHAEEAISERLYFHR